ncbi:MAG: family 78 glycoside hydrolase catalytic domain [Paludibacter sp.]|nr:family 78 glycoside hydrolase catalytic domain [Paludibacter sp.]
MKKKILLLIFCMMLVEISASNKSKVQITNLNCEKLSDPAGVETVQPRFSWILKSKERNQFQSGYQILVDTCRQNLDRNIGKIWDSRKVISDQSLFVTYEGCKLRPSTRYYWKVRVWDKKGNVSEWSEIGSWQMGLLHKEDWCGARWIGYKELPDSMRLVPGYKNADDYRVGNRAKERAFVPCFRKEFELKKKIIEATLYVSGLGQYECFVNGKRVGTDFISPGWTNYDKTVLYNTFDITHLLGKGANAIGIIVGNGFYYINKERYVKFVAAYGEPSLICFLKMKYSDGSVDKIVTDKSWKCSPSAITYSSIYGGEDYDATIEQKGWSEKGFDDSEWKNIILVKGPLGNLVAETDYPVKVMKEIEVKVVKVLPDSSYLYDFGQNASGVIEIQVKGKKGSKLKLIPSELITNENFPDQKASGEPYYLTYTLKGEGIERWSPMFSYYGFRYVQIVGAVPEQCKQKSNLPVIVGLKMLHTRNSSPETGNFNCSDVLLNETNNLIKWAIKSNMQSVLTDCPHREKHGWLEQTYLMGNSLAYNFDIYHLFRKIIRDMKDAQTEDGLVPSFVPEFRLSTGAFRDSPEWGSASIILPWMLYKIYGDSTTIREVWTMMTRYAGYLKTKSENNILSYGLGDWFDLGPADPGVSQLTPLSVTATAIYYYDLSLLAQMAGILNKKEEADFYISLAKDVKMSFNQHFFDYKKGVYSTGSQTAMAMPCAIGLVDEDYAQKVVNNLEDSIVQHDKRLTAGDIGFHFLVKTLTEWDMSKLLYEMNAREDVPGYGYQIKKGATALTESWQALKSVSNNHLMLGHIMEWFYAGLAGIRQETNSSAFKNIEIKPAIIEGIVSVKANHRSQYGNIVSEWYKSNKKLIVAVDIPVNTSAKIFLPASIGRTVVESNKRVEKNKDIIFIGTDSNRMIFQLGSGKYRFQIIEE